MAGFGGKIALQGETEYRAALKQITQNLALVSSEMKKVTAEYGKNDNSAAALTARNDVLNRKLDEQKKKVSEVEKMLEEAKKEYGENSDAVTKWQIELNKAEAEVIKTTKEIEKNTDALEENEKSAEDDANAIKEFGDEAEQSGDKALKLGDIIKGHLIADAIKAGIGAVVDGIKALGKAFADSVQAAGSFETSMAKASTLFGDVNVDTENLNKKMLELSSATGLAADELGGALYSALSAGIPVTEDMGEATAFLETAAKLAKAGFTDVDTSLSALAKTMNAYGMETDDADKIAKILIQTQNKGITTVDELGQNLAQVTPTAAAMGVSFENVGAALASMTAQGTPTAQATTQLNSLFAELGKSGTKAAQSLEAATAGTEYAGKSFTDLTNEGVSLGEILSLVGDYAAENNLSMLDMFSSIEAGKAALSITGDLEGFNENLAAMSTEADVVGEAYEKMAATFDETLNRTKTGLQNFMISIGTEFLPSIGGVLEGVNLMIGGSMEEGLAQIQAAIPEFLQKGADLINGLLNGIILMLPTIGQSAVDICLQLINTIVAQLPTFINAGIQIILSLINGIAQALPTLVPAIVDAVILIATSLLDNIGLIIDAGINLIIGLGQGLINAIPQLVSRIPQIINSLITGFLGNLPKFMTMGVKILIELGKGLIQAIPQVVAQIPKIITGILNAFKNGISKMKEMGVNLLKGLWEGISSWASNLLSKIGNVAKSVVDKFKSVFGIHSPSTVFAEMGVMDARGLGIGFENEMKQVNADMADAVNTNYNLDATVSGQAGGYSGFGYDTLVSAFKDALKGVAVVMDGDEMGEFVERTVTRVVYQT